MKEPLLAYAEWLSPQYGEVEKEDMPGVSMTPNSSWDGRVRSKPRWLLLVLLAGRGVMVIRRGGNMQGPKERCLA